MPVGAVGSMVEKVRAVSRSPRMKRDMISGASLLRIVRLIIPQCPTGRGELGSAEK